jgi:hypothetical protein
MEWLILLALLVLVVLAALAKKRGEENRARWKEAI